MLPQSRTVIPAALTALALAAGQASASVELISNMPGNDGTQSAALENGRIKGMAFLMPPGEDYTLDLISMRLNITSTGVVPLVRIFDDVGGLPGSELITLDNPVIASTGINTYEFTPPSSFHLLQDTTYWVVVYNIGASSLSWHANSPAITPTGLATHAGSSFSTSGGPNPPTGTSAIMNSYAVFATPASGGCYADCDGNENLNIDDFLCFINEFSQAQMLPTAQQITHYANCTGSTNIPVLTIDDFLCFINEFAQGCP